MNGFGRRGSAVIAAALASVVVVALGITASSAAYTDQEFVNGPVGTLDCDVPGEFNTQAWGQVVSAELLGAQLDPIVELDGLTVTNHETVPANDPLVSDPSIPEPGSTDLTDNAWASPISATLLQLINAQVGVGFLDSPDVGAYTQYGDAETDGTSTGASGVLTTSEGGVALGSTDPDAPGIGSLSLSGVLAEVLGDALADDIANLADLSLDIGAVASSTSIDACAPLWSGADLASSVVRDYLVASLGLSFESALIGELVTDITGLLTVLDGATDLEITAIADLDGILDDALDGLGLGLTSLLGVASTTVDVDVITDLSGISALLTGEITDTNGFVTINLTSGEISVDLDAILGSLNGLPPNTPILTPAVLNTIIGAIEDALVDFVNDVLEDAIVAALETASITATVTADLTVLGLAGVSVEIDLSGSYAAFQAGTPLITVDATADGLLIAAINLALTLAGLGIDVNDILDGIESGLAAELLGGLVPAITTAVATELDDLVAGLLTDLLDETTGLVPELLVELTPLFTLIQNIVDITVNVRPDFAPNPDAPVPPDIPVPGRYFESAIRISLLDPTITAPDGILEIYLANSSAGPNTPR